MRGHLGGCRACAALAGALQHMAEELPELAEVEVDDAFVGDVLAATLPHHVRAKRRLDAWTERLQRLLSRPRIAWEGAYLLTTFVVLLFGTPGSPFANVSKKALAIARTDPYTIQRPVVQLENRVSQGLQNAWQSTEVGVRSLAGDVAVQSNSAYGNIREEFGTLWLRLASDGATGALRAPRRTRRWRTR
jgi:hypothetical protein